MKIKINEQLEKYTSTVKKKHNTIWNPRNIKFTRVKNNTWFDIYKFVSKKDNKFAYDRTYKFDVPDEIHKCLKIKLFPNKEQRDTLNNWFNAYSKMYNETIKFLKEHFAKNKNEKMTFINFKQIRTKHLKQIRDNIMDKSKKISNDKKKYIRVHILDGAIKLACANYKTALTNFNAGRIKHFRIRYWRNNKRTKVLDIEKTFVKHDTICKNVFGMIKYKCDYDMEDFKLDNIEHESKIHYDRKTNQYTLLVPIIANKLKNKSKNEIISLDPGLRKFMTGISENEVIKIGDNCKAKLEKYFKKKDKTMKNKKFSNKKKKKIERMCNRKIKNYVTELHWKTIKYLTSNYKTILIGDMSAKNIVSNSGSLGKMNKRIINALSFYQFRQRLEYKCQLNGNVYRKIHEAYTSKVCSKCGYYHTKLGSNETYECPECKNKIDRDINGCRGIYIRQFM